MKGNIKIFGIIYLLLHLKKIVLFFYKNEIVKWKKMKGARNVQISITI